MVTARINPVGSLGKVTVRGQVKTTIADPNFKPKPNVALLELTDTQVVNVQDGDFIVYDAVTGKFKNEDAVAALDIKNINGGAF